MQINEHTALTTSKVLLVPYSTHHVATYHEWMQNPDLQSATASEPLTLDEEYDMQQSWRRDADKLTFIVCLPISPLSARNEGEASIKPGEHDSADRMIGDINLFLFEAESDDDDDSTSQRGLIGEIELMIARQDLQRQGYGRAALLMFMYYVLVNWKSIMGEYVGATSENDAKNPESWLAYLRVKINQTNERSIRLFQTVGFEQVSDDANYFGEIELRWRRDVNYLKQLEWYDELRRFSYE